MVHAAFTELAELARWVVWREEQRNGRSTKIPYQVNNAKASSTDPKTWRRLSHVLSAVEDFDGVGIVLGDLGNGRTAFGIDLDCCLSPDGLAPWATDIIKRFHTYAEISPSGAGLKVFGINHRSASVKKKQDYPAGRKEKRQNARDRRLHYGEILHGD